MWVYVPVSRVTYNLDRITRLIVEEVGSRAAIKAEIDGKTIMLAEVERNVSQQAGGKQAQLSQLELAQARLQVLGTLIQREVLFQRAEREKLLPTDDEITAIINDQKAQT